MNDEAGVVERARRDKIARNEILLHYRKQKRWLPLPGRLLSPSQSPVGCHAMLVRTCVGRSSASNPLTNWRFPWWLPAAVPRHAWVVGQRAFCIPG